MMEEVDWLAAHATDADKRKHTVEREAPRHYLDRDAPALSCLDTVGSAPWFSRASAACCEDTLWAYGVLPWQIGWSHARLVEAFDQKDRQAILRAAADLGHYVADAHVPLHTTLNYNGQLTGQEGLHSVWETRLPELFGGGYDLLLVESVEYVPDVHGWAWQVVMESHGHVAKVLSEERRVSASWAGGDVVREERGGVMQQQRAVEWCRTYDEALDGMVEERWRSAIRGVSSLWYSAWVDAGEPNLSDVLGGGESKSRRWRWFQRKEKKEDPQVP